jgi:hypothetical protein
MKKLFIIDKWFRLILIRIWKFNLHSILSLFFLERYYGE